MSALNGIVLEDSVHLLTDGAVYDARGKIKAIGAKVYEYRDHRLAIGWSGYCRMAMIHWGLRLSRAKDQRSILSALPNVARRIVEANGLFGLKRHSGDQGIRLMVALCDIDTDEPQLWALHSDNQILGPRYQPYSLIRLHRAFDILPGSEEQALGREITNWATFDPSKDGLALLEHQRAEAWEDGTFCVGGFAQLTSVTRQGVTSKILREWPDLVGEHVDPKST